jgi:hypothetical protein
MTIQEAKEILKTNKLNDLTTSGLGCIENTCNLIRVGIAGVLRKEKEKSESTDWAVCVEGVLNKEDKTNVEFYLIWLKGNKPGDDWAHSVWYVEFMYQINEIIQALIVAEGYTDDF